MTDRATPADQVDCAHCGCPVDLGGAREGRNGVWRVGCLSCGVQLVKRAGGPWETIRG